MFRIFEDSAGGIWAATSADSGNGLARIDSSGAVRVFGPADGLPPDLPLVHAFAEDRSGSALAAIALRYRF